MKQFLAVMILAGLLGAESAYIPVNAPFAQTLVVATKNAHPELQKLGLHAIPPKQHDYVIIANAIPSKIGKKSSESDLVVLYSGQPSVKVDERGKFFDLCLPIADASGRQIGITVMEILFSFAKDSSHALAQASRVRDELQSKIPSHAQLFSESNAPLVKLQTIPLSSKGRFDHLTVDPKHNRLFAAAEDDHSVLVFDLVDAKLIARIPVSKPHAILYRDESERLYVTDGEAGAVEIFNSKDYRPIGSIALKKDADSIGYDAYRHLLYVDNGGKDAGEPYSVVSVIDTDSDKKINDIRVESGTLEALALDQWRPRMYVDNPAANQVTVIDRWKNKITASWPVTLAKDNVAMALDEPHQRLFVGCRDGHIVIFDTNTGRELQSIETVKGVDDIEFDTASRRLYAIGNGDVDVFVEIDADHFRSFGRVAASAGAKTGRLSYALNRYFAAAPSVIDILEPLNLPDVRPPSLESAQVVHASHALELELGTLSAHPDLRKMGLHATPPGGKESVIIANANTSRIGVPSSAGDLAAVKDGKTYCAKRDDGSFYNLKLPLRDSSGHVIGILVMEMPYTSVPGEAEAIARAEAIRAELASQIPSYDSLFDH